MSERGVRATVVITTRNRKDELRAAIRSAFGQSEPVETLVIDDGSTDGTSEMVAREFPAARLVRSDVSKGLIAQRNAGAELARGEFIFSIDDDAEFSTGRVVEQTIAEFSSPRIGAVAIPFVEPKKEGRVFQRAPASDRAWVTDSYVGTAHVVRRDIFRRLGGYRADLVHQGEERDYAIRMLDAGYVVRLGAADVIIHHESPKRDLGRMDYYGRRNDLLFAWQNAPMPYLPVHMLATSLNGMAMAFRERRRRPWRMVRGAIDGWAACFAGGHARRPVRAGAYRLSRRLRTGGPAPLDEIEALLAPLPEAAA